MLHWFLKVIYRDNLNKNDAVMEKEEDLIEWIRDGIVIYVRSIKDFKIVWEKKTCGKK